MIAKVLYHFGELSRSSDFDEHKLEGQHRIERVTKYINNGELFVQVDFPSEFVEIYPMSRKIRKTMTNLTGVEPKILKIQCLN
jgi:hypothetical protein